MVLSQVYGGGGNSGATLKNDYIELYNGGASAVSLAGWSVQYASASGTTWQVTNLGAYTLQPGQYYLIQEAQGAGGTQNLPTPDATGTIPMSGTAGKVALVSSTTALSGSAPSSPSIVDVVGFGSANFYEGSGPAPAPSNTAADLRAAAGCTDTDQNNSDFATATPVPRNTASPKGSCSVGGGGTPRSIPQIQGSGCTSPYAGQLVQTTGVVTLLTNNGYFLQDLTGDGNPATSDGIFVFNGSAPTVAVGQLIQLTATVAEFNVGAAGNTDTATHTVTELTGPTGLSVLGTGYTLTPTAVTLPELVNDDLERYEGMLVTIAGPLSASQNYFQGRYGQVTLSAGGRMETPTNRYRPGTAQALALADQNARSRIILDDATSVQNPNPTPYMAADNTLRAGDTLASVTGIVDYGLATNSNTGFGDYKLQPTQPLVFTRANPRTATPPKVGGNLKIASFNVLNYFTTFTDGKTADGQSGQGCLLGGVSSPANCRGADNLAEFQRQRAKIVEAIAAIDADALGLMEMQNNGMVAVQNLVDGLNARLGAGTYAAVPDPAAGTGSDAIKVAMFHMPARLARVGLPRNDTDAVNNRPPLAQTFAAANGETFTLIVNHLKSKSSCPAPGDADYAGNFDNGDGQGCWNARRVQQAQRLYAQLGTLSPGTPNALLLGDFNAYAQEDPIDTLTGAGLVDQIARFNGFGYSYVFDGAAGRIDHAITTTALSDKVTRAVEWHINADEPSVIDYNTEFKQPLCPACGPDYYSATPYRSSDHDPVVLGLQLSKVIRGTPGRDVLVGSAGDDLFIGAEGADTLTGGTGINTYQYNSIKDAGDTITDFVPAKDLIDLRNLLAGLGWAGSDPVADGLLRIVDVAGGASLQIDTDGPAGPAVFRPLLTLKGVAASQVLVSRDLVLRAPNYGLQHQRKAK